MPQFDVFRLSSGELVLDCQSDLLTGYNTRLVVPLLPLRSGPRTLSRLNPVFDIADRRWMMATEFASATPETALRVRVTSLEEHEWTIKAAFDYLITGY